MDHTALALYEGHIPCCLRSMSLSFWLMCLYLYMRPVQFCVYSEGAIPQTISRQTHTVVPTHLARCRLWWCQHRRGWAPPPSPLLLRYQPARQTALALRHNLTALPHKSQSAKGVNYRSYHDGVFGELSSDRLDKLHKVLRVAVGHIQTDVLESRDGLQDGTQLLQICSAAAWAGSYMLGKKRTFSF